LAAHELTAAEAGRSAIDKSGEAPLYPDRRDVEIELLATLARSVNSHEADLKCDLLELETTDFHLRDHRAIGAAMKQLGLDTRSSNS
jgi:hypothetical protein